MRKTVVAIAALLLVASGPIRAQAANARPDSAAEAKAAMERAQRLAANPMKVILQAGKIRRKAEPEVVAEAPDANLRRTAARPADAAAVPLTRGLAAVPTATTAAVAALAVSTAPLAAPADEARPQPVPASVAPAGVAGDNLPALEAAPAVAETAPAVAKAVPPQAVLVVPAAANPTLVSMVEPDIPVRLLSSSGRVSEVMADLTLRADGTVGAVALVSPLPRTWKPYITAALEQWRFEPLPSARVHRVQLVFEER